LGPLGPDRVRAAEHMILERIRRARAALDPAGGDRAAIEGKS
jgi:hypothetical protein